MKRHDRIIAITTIVAVIILAAGCTQTKVSGVKQKKERSTAETENPDVRPAKQGEQLFSEKGCDDCHWLGDSGGEIGPELTHEGLKRDAAWLDRWLKDPKTVNPNTAMPTPDLTDEERAALVKFLASQK